MSRFNSSESASVVEESFLMSPAEVGLLWSLEHSKGHRPGLAVDLYRIPGLWVNAVMDHVLYA